MSRVLITLLALTLLGVRPAYAYIDPGAGSLFLQLLLGGIGGLIVAVRIFWRKFRARNKAE